MSDTGFICWINTYCKGVKADQNARIHPEMILHYLKSFFRNSTTDNAP